MKGMPLPPRRRAGYVLLAGLAAGCLVGGVVGLVDGLWAAARFARYEQGEALHSMFYVHTAALDLLLLAIGGLVYGVACAAAPFPLGPLALVRRIGEFARRRGEEGARRTARIWATLLTLGLLAWAIFRLSYHFATAYRNKPLAALALVAALLPVVGVTWALRASLDHHLGRLSQRLARRGGFFAAALGPVPLLALLGVGLVIAVVLAIQWAAPIQAALPWRTALLAGLGVGGVWLLSGLLLRWDGRAALVVTAGLSVGGVGLVATSYATFGNGPASRLTADVIERRTALATHVLRPLARRLDEDGDGYPGWLGGGDCDDHRATVHPAAVEIPDNGVDENCSGGDLRRAELPAVLRRPRPRPTPSPVRRRRYNVVVVVVDALRADRVGWAGYRRKLTPALDRLAARSVVFRHAYTPSPRTSLALPALLTGLYPSELRRSGGYFMQVRRGNPSVAARFRRAGYVTLASVCHPYLRDRSGLRRGFDQWRVYSERTKHEMNSVATSARVVDNALALLTQHRKGRLRLAGPRAGGAPFFLFLYTMDPHTHYLRHPPLADYGRSLGDRYDAEIRYTDHHLGRLLDDLERHGQLKDTLVIVTADHGEAFGENGVSFHGLWLYEHQVHVPLLLYIPGLKRRHINARVSLMDLAPTLFDLTGVASPPRIQGVSLRPWLAPRAPPLPPRVVYVELLPSIDNHLKRAVLLGDWKLVHQPRGDRFRLYDLKADPGERRNLLQSRPEKARTMKHLYEAYVATQLKIRAHGP